jgi:hypothetical protein
MTRPIPMTPRQARRTMADAAASRTPVSVQKRTSDLMVRFMHLIEEERGARLTPEEARNPQFVADARAYAKMVIRWTRPEKGKPK